MGKEEDHLIIPVASDDDDSNSNPDTNTTSIVATSSSGDGDGGDSDQAQALVVKKKKSSNIPFEFPPGFRFNPHDHELIIHYLRNKVLDRPLPYNNINDVNLYKYNPEDLIEDYKSFGEKDWYFFTPRDRKYRNGSRPNRAAGDGFWKATGADKPIKNNEQIIGFRKALVFYRGKPTKASAVKTNWIMHEYRVNDNPGRRLPRSDGSMRLDDWVLCRIHWKPEKAERRPQRERRSEDGLIVSNDSSELGEMEMGDHEQESVGPVNNYDIDTDQDLLPNNQPVAGVFNPTPTDYGVESWTTLAEFGDDMIVSLDHYPYNMALDPYSSSFLTNDPNMYAPPNQSVGAKSWKMNAIRRGKEDFFLSKPENYDLPSQIDIYNKSVLNSQRLFDEGIVYLQPSSDALHNPPAIRPMGDFKRYW
ncbi:hypothetical protein ACLOJK_039130 [Asimina triloba]